MASTEQQQRVPGTSEEEPLLGARGDASQVEGKPLYHNFVLGTGVMVQAGVWVIAAIIWGAVFSIDLSLFSAHPLLNSAAFLFLIQAILILQPTHTRKQKKQGTYVHSALNGTAFLAAVAGLVVIEYNKFSHNGTHFVSTHAILGLVTYILILIQVLAGALSFYAPGLLGGEEKAKGLYKYHRVGGYVTTVLMIFAIGAATTTDFNVNVLGIQLWAIAVASVVLVVGLAARIRLSKFGWLAGK
ncbi:unnamed protein product [Zymoseptoria tritici ST99CH_1A5]|uniref:Cytochrome b561 domain-containing protein n=2 Tax=Zymoseptoria tritici TaxID=1047171 RepID=F9XDK8_ZYMTI|nr:uncharacterized protein MYCGRDRAFT_73220 [Zymoseptoria tritici IPO323]EGP86786.1 hypothetical protein MYCGRDRAFT_73220 [Zymoseptoria tritici IPO323]SMY25449.1 unnamed protein product [Zymoseptoria tritici ST99CH_1A5]